MSHFSVAVITDSIIPTHEEIAEILKPWREYDSTSIHDHGVEFISLSEEELDDCRRRYIPNEQMKFFVDWMLDRGYKMENGKWGRYMNPNSRWNWFAIGGRWPNLLKIKKDNDGCIQVSTDQGRVCDIDFELMRQINSKSRMHHVDNVMNLIQKNYFMFDRDQIFKIWRKYIVELVDLEKKYISTLESDECVGTFDEYCQLHGSESFKVYMFSNRMNPSYLNHPFFGVEIDPSVTDLDDWIMSAPALETFVVVKDGKWYEKGKVGWWGIVRGRVLNSEWSKKYDELLRSLQPNNVITIVDCHI